jgi:hypothetical protein
MDAGCGATVISVTPLPNPLVPYQQMAVDATSVYWIDTSGVRKAPVGGGTAVTLAVGPPSQTGYMAIDSTSVYWTVADSVLKVPLDGALPPNPPYTTIAAGQSRPQGIALDAANVYWVNSGNYGASDGSVVEMPLSGGVPVTLASGRNAPGALILAASRLVWTEAGGLWTVGLSGGTPTSIASPSPGGFGMLAFDGTDVYWTNADGTGGTIQKVPLSGGAQVTLAPTGSVSWPTGIAVDSTAVYWATLYTGGTENSWGTIVRAALDGSAPCTIYSGAQPGGTAHPMAIAVDSTSIYWTGQGGVMKATPK